MSDLLTVIRPASDVDVDVVAKMQTSDEHDVFRPTFVVERGRRVVGALNIHLLPIVAIWMDKTLSKRHESRDAIMFIENSLREKGSLLIGISCEEKSPFRPFIERVGYKKLNQLFVKRL